MLAASAADELDANGAPRATIRVRSPVRVSQGGCAHFDQTVAISLSKPATAPDKFGARFWLDYAEKTRLSAGVSSEGAERSIESSGPEGYSAVSLAVKDEGGRVVLTVEVNAALETPGGARGRSL